VPLRRRIGLIAGASVAAAVLIAALVSYFVVRDQLRGQVDSALLAQQQAIEQSHTLPSRLPTIPPSAGGPAPYVDVVLVNGQPYSDVGNLTLPVTAQTLHVASGQRGSFFSDAHVGNNHLRVLTFPGYVTIGDQTLPAAIQLARPLNWVDNVMSELRLVLLLVFLGGIGMAVVLGRVAARRVLSPLAEVAEAAEHIGETDDLSNRIRVHADDEVGALATRFNSMLDRLEGSRAELDESVRAQRQLVADASHELRTPVTSLRTNIEVLLQGGELDPEDRRRLLTDVVEQSEELSALVNDLIELARGDEPGFETEDVRLDRIAAESVARSWRNDPQIEIRTALEPVTLDGVPARLGRAINNLLDNAARHSPPGGIVEVTVDRAGVRVRDHGPGVAEPDLPYVFDRFFRGTNSRGTQGSGLGLAIVRQVTTQHGGSATVANAPDGGAVFTLHLPVVPATGDEEVPLDGDDGPTKRAGAPAAPPAPAARR
jgi:two-component system sensor histidine kinase MprB